MCHCRDFDWCKFVDLHRNMLCIGEYVEARWCHGQVCVHSSKYILLFFLNAPSLCKNVLAALVLVCVCDCVGTGVYVQVCLCVCGGKGHS